MKIREYIYKFINMEILASSLYEKIALTLEKDLCEVSLVFAAQERVHAEKLTNIKDSVEDMEVNIDEQYNNIIEEIEKQLKNEEVIFTNEKDFFLFALKIEKDAIFLYEKFKDLFDINSNPYKVFKELVSEEKNHMIFILKKLHELK